MDNSAKIKSFILREIAVDAGLELDDVGDEESLIDAGILDSLGMLKLIAFLDDEFEANIMSEDFDLNDFATLSLIYGWVQSHSGEDAQPTSESSESSVVVAKDIPSTTPMPSVSELRNAVEMGLRDRVVLVTGASRGIGETIAKLFSIYDSRVVINYARQEAHATRVAREIDAAGGQAFAVRADVSDPDQVKSMIASIEDHWGPVEILVNNAAGDATPTEFAKLTWHEIEESIDVVLRGAFNCCQAVVPRMLQAGRGKIISIGSLATDSPAPNQLKYVVAKSALVGLTRSLAVDYASRNIQVNLVSPSVVETDLIAHIPEGFREKIAQNTPMQRNATPVDVAQAVVYLASDQSKFTTGQKIQITGGAIPFL